VDIVLVGLPGSGKSVVGRRLAHRHGAAFIDLDDLVERSDGRPIPDIFAEDGEAAFRTLERQAITGLGPADTAPGISRVIATGGGAVVEPANRWALYRGRVTVWLDGRPEVLAQRLRRSPNVRPLITGHDPIGTIRGLAQRRERYYAAADIRQSGVAELSGVVDAIERRVHELARGVLEPGSPSVLLDAPTPLGRFVLGDRIAAPSLIDTLRRMDARRAILVSEPGAWSAVGEALAARLVTAGLPVERILLPQGEAAKRMAVVATAASQLAGLGVGRDEALVAVGGGALGDAAGFLAATYLRGIPLIHVPTTLVAQIDSSIGGKTAIDLPEGKNLVGAFHQPIAIIADVATLATLPARDLRGALGEAVKMAALGDERLFGLLERDGSAIPDAPADLIERGVVAELVERCGWAKMEVVMADERERANEGGRITLNLGHSLGHAVEAAGGYADLLHGEAVAYGLRAACEIGRAMGVTPPERARRILGLLDRVGLARESLPYPLETVLGHLRVDKKHVGGKLRWVLPTADGVTIRADVPAGVVSAAAASLLMPGRAS